MRWRALIWDWLPVVVWMAVIAWFSTDLFSAQKTESIIEPVVRYVAPEAPRSAITLINAVIRKLAHASEYALLALLWYRALLRSAHLGRLKAMLLSLAVACAWAVGDELHQLTVPSRTGNPLDVALDASGALTAMLVAAWRGPRQEARG